MHLPVGPHHHRSRSRRRLVTLTACLATAALLVVGCGGGAPDSPPGVAEQGGEADRRLRLALNFPPVAALSPFSDDAVLLSRMGVTETLVIFDEGGVAQPQLATAWEFTDPATARMTLRDGVVFQDGTPVDAEAVAASLTRAVEAPTAPRAVAGLELSFTALDPTTLQVRATEPDALLVQRLAAPGLAVLSPAAYQEDPTAPDPVGTATGPFRITSVQGGSGATLEAHSDYWGGTPSLTGVDVNFVGDAAARSAGIRAGELDVAQNIPIAQLGQLTDVEIQSIPVSRVVGVYLNTDRGPLADPGLRAAARAALDPAPVVSGVYEGEADIARGLFRSDSDWVDDRPEPTYGQPAPATGQRIRLATWDDRPELPEAVSVVADQLRSAGFTVDVTVQAYSTLEAQMLDGEFDAVLGSRLYLGDTGDPIGYLDTDFTCDGAFNPARLCDPAIDRAVTAVSAVSDPGERRAAAVDLEAQVLATDAFVPLLHERTRTAHSPVVVGLGADPFERVVLTAETTLSS